MLRYRGICLGSFVLNQRVIADWWHPHYRLDVYKKARARLAAIQEAASSSAASDEYNSQNTSKCNNSGNKDSKNRFTTGTFYEEDQSQLDEQHDLQWEQQLYGMTLESSFLQKDDDDEEKFRASLEAALNTKPSLTLYEANALVGTFSSYHNDVELSSILQHIREHLNHELCNYHYHALLRVFNYNHDKSNTLQLLDVMVQRDELTQETYARIMDSLHSLLISEPFEKLLSVVQLANEAFGSLVYAAKEGSEAITVAAYSNSIAAHNASTSPNILPTFNAVELEEREEEKQEVEYEELQHKKEVQYEKESTKTEEKETHVNHVVNKRESINYATSPVLTSLLYHVCTTGDAGGPISALLIALWIRALGVQLCDWDYVLLLSSLLAQMETFPLVRLLLGAFFDAPQYYVSVSSVLSRVMHYSNTLSLPHNLTSLIRVMTQSLEMAKVNMHTPIFVGVINTQTTRLESMIDCIMHHATCHGSVGPLGYNASELFHALSIIYSVKGNNTRAAETFVRAFECARATQEENNKKNIIAYPTDKNNESTAETRKERACINNHHYSNNTNENLAAANAITHPPRSVCEPFQIDFKYMLDIATLFPRLSHHTLHRLKSAFITLSQITNAAANEEELRRNTTFMSNVPALSSTDNNNNNNNNNVNNDDSDTTHEEYTNMNNNSSDCDNNCSSALIPTLIASQRFPTLADALCCEAATIPFMETYEEAHAMLKRIIATIDPTRSRHSRGTRMMLKQFTDFCAQHPRRNCKLTSVGLEERRKWGNYIQARDTALTLYGSVRQARDAMKHLFYHDNRLPPLRSAEMILKDVDDVAKFFFKGEEVIVRDAVHHELLTRRTSQPHLRFCPDAVPRHLWDPHVYNYYPHVMLKGNNVKYTPGTINEDGNNSSDNNNNAQGKVHYIDTNDISNDNDDNYANVRKSKEKDKFGEEDDLFAELWRTLMNRKVVGNDIWYLQNAEMYVSLMRCLLYRLDWEAAVHLTSKIHEFNIYNHFVDAQLNAIFVEIGDPAGCLPFKVATKLFDGRILHHGMSSQATS